MKQEALPGTQSECFLILDFSASRTKGKKEFSIYKLSVLSYLVVAEQSETTYGHVSLNVVICS
jgi:hypothetical protein